MSAATEKPAAAPGLLVGMINQPLANHTVRLSDPEMKPFMDGVRQRIKSEPGYARQMLINIGMIDADGKLTKLYGG